MNVLYHFSVLLALFFSYQNSTEGISKVTNKFNDLVVNTNHNIIINGDTTFANVVIEPQGILILNGTIHANNLTIKSTGLITHDTRKLDGLYLDILGEISIDKDGKIDVSGKGLLGGLGPEDGETYDTDYTIIRGTSQGNNRINPGFGGAGASYGGIGSSIDTNIVELANPYGNLVFPDLLGSGGGGTPCGSCEGRGGNGGGKIRINCSRLIHNGELISNGNPGSKAQSLHPAGGGGSGGSIWINAKYFNGQGLISSNGGQAILGFYEAGSGGGGRIAIHSDTINFPLENITSFGGVFFNNATAIGSAGTIYLKSNLHPNGVLVVKNGPNINNSPAIRSTPLLSPINSFDKIIVGGLTELSIEQSHVNSEELNVYDSIIINNGSIYIGENLFINKNHQESLVIDVKQNSTLTINSGCSFNASSVFNSGIIESASSLSFASPSNFLMKDNGYLYIKDSGTVVLDEFNPNNIIYGTVNIGPNATLVVASDKIEIGPSVRLVKDGKFGTNDFISNLLIQNQGTILHSDRLESGVVINANVINVESGGSIDVTDRGLRGGDGSSVFENFGETYSDSGKIVANKGSEGNMPNGASHGGHGGLGADNDELNNIYGDKFNPKYLGSGGNGKQVANIKVGAGGGRITINTDTLLVNGLIAANGGSAYRDPRAFVDWGSGGSGGSILINTDIINGSGYIKADGGAGLRFNGNGGGGRIAIYTNGGNFSQDHISVTSPLPNDNKGEDGTIVFDVPASPANLIVNVYQRSVNRLGTTHKITIDVENRGGTDAYDILLKAELKNWESSFKAIFYNEEINKHDTLIVDSNLIGSFSEAILPLWIPKINKFSKQRIILNVLAKKIDTIYVLTKTEGNVVVNKQEAIYVPHTPLYCNVSWNYENYSDFSLNKGDTTYIEESLIYKISNEILETFSKRFGLSLNFYLSGLRGKVNKSFKEYLVENLELSQIIPIQHYVRQYLIDENITQLSNETKAVLSKIENIYLSKEEQYIDFPDPERPSVSGFNNGLNYNDLIGLLKPPFKGINLLSSTPERRRVPKLGCKDPDYINRLAGSAITCDKREICYYYHSSWDFGQPFGNEEEVKKFNDCKMPVHPIFIGETSKNTDVSQGKVCIEKKIGNNLLEACYHHLKIQNTFPRRNFIEFDDTIGFACKTNANEKHLHVQVKYNGKLIDPNCMYGICNDPEDLPFKKSPSLINTDDEFTKEISNTGCSFSDGLVANDPNAIIGHDGVSENKYLKGNETLPYTIFFENMPDATLSAREIHLCDTLDLNKFDLSTLEFGEIAVGNKTVSLPNSKLKNQEYIIPKETGDSFRIKIVLSVDSILGVIHWYFNTIDTAQDIPTEDNLLGFLPPNKNPPEGDGYINYTIKALPNLATGTELLNSAAIIFDVNQSIRTNVWRNTIDNTGPVTSFNPVDSVLNDSIVCLKWSGEDDGVGLQFVNVYISVNDSAFVLFEDSITNDSLVFSFNKGNKYALYTIGTDSLGNIEALKETPDITFSVISGCKENDPEFNKTIPELCNGIDDNCNGKIDEGFNVYYLDNDFDGYGDPNNSKDTCAQPIGYVLNNTDCYDQNSSIHPMALEVCNNIDDDCDGNIDDGILYQTYYKDQDLDGYGNALNFKDSCAQPLGYVLDNTDCNDLISSIHPMAIEVCNNIDEDCDGNIDEGLPINTFFADQDGDLFYNSAVSKDSCAKPIKFILKSEALGKDCNDNNSQLTNNCNSIPNPVIICPKDSTIFLQAFACDIQYDYIVMVQDLGTIDSLKQIIGLSSGLKCPLGITYNTWVAYGKNGTNDSCTFSVKVVEFGTPGFNKSGSRSNLSSLSCRDRMNVSLGNDCYLVIAPKDVIAGNYGCIEDLEVSLNYPFGTDIMNPKNQLNRSHLGYEIIYLLKDNSTGNSCWGVLKIEDKLPPQIGPTIEYKTCFDLRNIFNGNYKVPDNCSDSATVSIISETYKDYGCDSIFYQGIIIRHLLASDQWGNQTKHTKQIYILKTPIDKIICPPNKSLSSVSLKDKNGNPDPQISGALEFKINGHYYSLWPKNPICKVSLAYKDERLDIKGFGYKIFRTWYIVDWCTYEEMECSQWIEVHDGTAITNENTKTTFELIGDLPSNISSKTAPQITEADIAIYPNPNRGTFTINLKGFEMSKETNLTIYSVLGSKILAKKVINTSNVNVDLYDYKISNGLYILIAKQGINILEKKFVVSK